MFKFNKLIEITPTSQLFLKKYAFFIRTSSNTRGSDAVKLIVKKLPGTNVRSNYGWGLRIYVDTKENFCNVIEHLRKNDAKLEEIHLPVSEEMYDDLMVKGHGNRFRQKKFLRKYQYKLSMSTDSGVKNIAKQIKKSFPEVFIRGLNSRSGMKMSIYTDDELIKTELSVAYGNWITLIETANSIPAVIVPKNTSREIEFYENDIEEIQSLLKDNKIQDVVSKLDKLKKENIILI